MVPAEPGRRNRRVIDAVFLLAGALVVGLTAAVAANAPEQDASVAHALITVLGWAGALWHIAYLGNIVLALVIVVDVVLHRRWALARDVLVATAAVFGLGSVLGGVVQSDWFPVEAHVFSHWGFPEIRLAAATAIIVVVGPELVRAVRLFAAWLVPVAWLGAIVTGAARPSEALAGLALGLAVGALVRLVFGSAAGTPPIDRVRAGLAALGTEVTDLAAARRHRVGYAEYVGHDSDGRPISVRVLGRDAQDTQRLARRWRLLAYRDPPRSAPVGRLEQVEHEALATVMAATAGARVPEVVSAALSPEGDAFLVTRRPDAEPLEEANPDDVSDELLGDLFHQVASLHAAGISHGRLNLSNVLATDDGPMLVDLSAATLGAPQSAIDIDVAELLVACTVLVGDERVLRHAGDAGLVAAAAQALPYLQRAALTPHLRDLARSHEVGLKDLREQVAKTAGEDVPALVPMRRIRIRDFLFTAMIGLAIYLVIAQLAKIGFHTIAEELRHAEIAWVVLGLILAQLTFVGGGIAVRGTVTTPLPLLPCIVLQSATKFINMTVPSSAGAIAINVRFLQRMGTPTSQAVVAGAVSDLSKTLMEIGLVLVTLPFVKIAIDTGDLTSRAPSGSLIVGVVLGLALIVAVLLAIPAVRAKVLPPIRTAVTGLRTVLRDRHKRLELFGGHLSSEILYALTLGAVCHAYGVGLSLAALLLVNTAASSFSGLIPTPGGVGAAEASLTAGLVAVGVGSSVAFAIAFTHRICTYYLPPIWGYFSTQWLSRKAYI